MLYEVFRKMRAKSRPGCRLFRGPVVGKKEKPKTNSVTRVHVCGGSALRLRDSGTLFVFRSSFFVAFCSSTPLSCPPPFTTEVNYVRVDMYPTSGERPITDLQQAEVEILEDGIPQKIAQFEQVTVGSSRPQTTAREPSTMNEMRRAAQDPRARIIVLFLDSRFVAAEGALRIWAPLIDALNKLIGADDLIAVMTPEMPASGLTFTRRTGSIEQMLSGLWGTKGWIGTGDRAGGPGPILLRPADYRRWTVDCARDDCPPPRAADAQRPRRAHPASARSPEERKAVIAVTDGWPLDEPIAISPTR